MSRCEPRGEGLCAHYLRILPGSVEPSANIRQSVVGAEVELAKGVTLDRCVVWPRTAVTRSASNPVITPEQRIEVSCEEAL
jgi:ADP-glucose pyrophosphorylase